VPLPNPGNVVVAATVVVAFAVVAVVGVAAVVVAFTVVGEVASLIAGATIAADTVVCTWLDGDSDERLAAAVDAELSDFGLGFEIADPTAITPTKTAGIMNRFRRHHGRVALPATGLDT
jgi:hypothetical protein